MHDHTRSSSGSILQLNPTGWGQSSVVYPLLSACKPLDPIPAL